VAIAEPLDRPSKLVDELRVGLDARRRGPPDRRLELLEDPFEQVQLVDAVLPQAIAERDEAGGEGVPGGHGVRVLRRSPADLFRMTMQSRV
jgi:hypothetical protein